MNVAVLGASDKPDRYSYKAVKMLEEFGHTVFPVHPRVKAIDGHPVFAELSLIPDPLDTITVYVSPEISDGMVAEIAEAKPRRVIFNPGAENSDLAQRLGQSGIQTVEACTLVMLRTKQF